MKTCPYCPPSTYQFDGSVYRCAKCNHTFKTRRLPIRLILALIALALVVLAFLSISHDFYWQGRDITGCVTKTYTTTRPAWMCMWGGGW